MNLLLGNRFPHGLCRVSDRIRSQINDKRLRPKELRRKLIEVYSVGTILSKQSRIHTASPPPLFATSPRKPHPHPSPYLWNEVLRLL